MWMVPATMTRASAAVLSKIVLGLVKTSPFHGQLLENTVTCYRQLLQDVHHTLAHTY
jgi:hypothetical protein